MTQAEFCQFLGQLNRQRSGVASSLRSASYGIGRLNSALALARRQVEDLQRVHVFVPLNANLYAQLNIICPGLLPTLPADAAKANAILNALNALLSSETPAQTLNRMAGDPKGRLLALQSTLNGITNQVKSLVTGAAVRSTAIPSSAGALATSASKLVKKEATALASAALQQALAAAGINPQAALRCASRLCSRLK